jgi:hypothetical protein
METERVTVWNGVGRDGDPDASSTRTSRGAIARVCGPAGFAATGGGVQGLFEAVVERLGVRRAVPALRHDRASTRWRWCDDLDEPLERRARAGIWPADGIEARVVDPETRAGPAADQEGELWPARPAGDPGLLR